MLKNKANNKKGFTLAELLIVVAIIGILVAISFPIFTSQLDKSRKATDDANLRAAKSAASVLVLDKSTPSKEYYYNVEKGILQTEKPSTAYGKHSDNEGKVIKVTISKSETEPVKVVWEPLGSTSAEE